MGVVFLNGLVASMVIIADLLIPYNIISFEPNHSVSSSGLALFLSFPLGCLVIAVIYFSKRSRYKNTKLARIHSDL